MKWFRRQDQLHHCPSVSCKARFHAASGFTLMELLVASFMSMVVLSSLLGAVVSTKKFVARDSSRIQANQDLRAIMQVIGRDIRITGQKLGAAFPAVHVIDGGEGPDTMVLRRRVMDETLTVCDDITGQWITVGTEDGDVSDSGDPPDVEPSCLMGADGALARFEAFSRRREDEGGTLAVYLYNPTSRQGVFLEHVQEQESAKRRRLKVNWRGSVDRGAFPARSVLIVMEEKQYSINPSTAALEVAINQPIGPVRSVGNNISQFNVRARCNCNQDNPEWNSKWDLEWPWGHIREVEISLTLTPSAAAPLRATDRTLVSRFFPRNVLSF